MLSDQLIASGQPQEPGRPHATVALFERQPSRLSLNGTRTLSYGGTDETPTSSSLETPRSAGWLRSWRCEVAVKRSEAQSRIEGMQTSMLQSPVQPSGYALSTPCLRFRRSLHLAPYASRRACLRRSFRACHLVTFTDWTQCSSSCASPSRSACPVLQGCTETCCLTLQWFDSRLPSSAQ